MNSRMVTNGILISAVVLCACASACERHTLTFEEYKAWLYSSRSELTDSIQRSNATYTLTLLPKNYRSALSMNDPRVVALLRITPNRAGQDVLLDNIESFADYSERVSGLAFRMKDLFFIRMGNTVKKAVGSSCPYSRGLLNRISVYVTFPISEKDLEAKEHCTIECTDDVLGGGKMSWDFTTSGLGSYELQTDEK